MRHSYTISRRVLWQMRSNLRGLFALFILPILLTSVVGFSVVYPFENVDVAVVNLDEGYSLNLNGTVVHMNMASDILARINATRLHLIPQPSYEAAMQLLRDGKVRAVIFFSPEFTKWALYEMNLTSDVPFSSFQYRLELDDSYVPLSLYISSEVYTALQKTVEDLFTRGDTENLMSAFTPVQRNSHSNLPYIFAVIMVITLFSVSLFNSSLIMLRERIQHTMDRLISARFSLSEFYLGYAISFLVITIIELSIFMAGLLLVVPGLKLISSQALLLFLVLIVFSLSVQNIGMAISFLFRREMDVIMSLPPVLMLAMMLGDVFYPPESFQGVVSLLTLLNPITYAMHSTLFLISGGSPSGVVVDFIGLGLLLLGSLAGVYLAMRKVFRGL